MPAKSKPIVVTVSDDALKDIQEESGHAEAKGSGCRPAARATRRHTWVKTLLVHESLFCFFLFASAHRFFIISEIRLRPSADKARRRL